MAEPSRLMDAVDARVLTALSRDPVANERSLAVASNLSRAGLAKRLRKLGEAGVLYPGFARAQVAYPAVGLEMSLVFAGVPNTERKRFERACDLHPYTQFRIRCMGEVQGRSFFTLFAYPSCSRHRMLAYLDALREEGVVDSYWAEVPIAAPKRQEFDFTFYNQETGRWGVDWGKWEGSIGDQGEELQDLVGSSLHLLDSKDMKILRLLSMDAREEKSRIAEKAGVRDYELSRRLAAYRERGVISDYRVIHAKSISSLAITVVAFARASVSTTEKICGALGRLPFQGTVYPIEGGMVYLGNVPSSELANLTRSLEANSDGVEVGLYDYTTSMRYIFDNDPSNYVEGAGWKRDRGYMVDAPLAALGQPAVPATTGSGS
ncbi:MAG: winged helix-turn-helix transcriptional regulator [Nitrososphaerota archaeon]|nr:winged helix-turn-helix transcriptional regulator [Nitrososphaerota archaeon]